MARRHPTRKHRTRKHRTRKHRTRKHRGGAHPKGYKVCMGTDGICYSNEGKKNANGNPSNPFKETKDKYCDNPKAPQC